jgi:hypothetical protein
MTSEAKNEPASDVLGGTDASGRQGYQHLRHPIGEKPSHQLSWSHHVELLKLDDPLERSFYEKQAIAEGWSVPELRRQKASSLFLRLAASKDKACNWQRKGRSWNSRRTFCGSPMSSSS